METQLNLQPVTTVDYVKYLEYLDDANNVLEKMENELDYNKELYDIMEEFEIPVPDEDMDNYLGVSVTMASLRNLVDKKLDELVMITKKFNDQMNKDISTLISEVGTIKDECMQPWLYDIDSNIGEVTEFLNDLYDRLISCQKRAAEFKGYQKQFRVSTRFIVPWKQTHSGLVGSDEIRHPRRGDERRQAPNAAVGECHVVESDHG